MIKGWKNNPEWVRLHREIKKEKMERRMQKAKLEIEVNKLLNGIRYEPLVQLVSTEHDET